MAKIKPIPPGHDGITPYITVQGGDAAIAFYVKVFGAKEVYRLGEPGGKVAHAELLLGGRPLMLSDEYPEMDVLSPTSRHGSPVALHLYVEDVDAVVERALAAGSRIMRPVEDQFYGDRGGKLRDPFGHVWWIATHIEDLTPEEIEARAKKLFSAA